MAFLRKRTIGDSGFKYVVYYLVESKREGKKMKQKTLAYLGESPDLDIALWWTCYKLGTARNALYWLRKKQKHEGLTLREQVELEREEQKINRQERRLNNIAKHATEPKQDPCRAFSNRHNEIAQKVWKEFTEARRAQPVPPLSAPSG
jgi:hypothetical protein